MPTDSAKTNGHGGKRKGAGRPPTGTEYAKIRLTPEQREKLKRLGGSAWIREQIQKA